MEAGGGAKAHHGGKRMHADPGEGGQRARRPRRVSEWVTCVTPRRTLVSGASTAVVPRSRGRSSTRAHRWAGGRSGRPSLSHPPPPRPPLDVLYALPPAPASGGRRPLLPLLGPVRGAPRRGTSLRGGGRECVCVCVSTLRETEKGGGGAPPRASTSLAQRAREEEACGRPTAAADSNRRPTRRGQAARSQLPGARPRTRGGGGGLGGRGDAGPSPPQPPLCRE